jgi:kynurenine 3-monooxygenase
MRKAFDDFLFWLMPNAWVPLYNSVSFSHMKYKKCIDNRAWQDKTLNNAVKYGGFIAACAFAIGTVNLLRNASFNWNFVDMMNKLKF